MQNRVDPFPRRKGLLGVLSRLPYRIRQLVKRRKRLTFKFEHVDVPKFSRDLKFPDFDIRDILVNNAIRDNFVPIQEGASSEAKG